MALLENLHQGDRPLQALAGVMAAGLLVLLGGLWYVQIVAGKKYAEEQVAQSFRTVRIPAVRGKIVDRDGRVLAENRPAYHASVYLEALSPYFRQAYALLVSNEAARVRAQYHRNLTREERATLARAARYMVASNVVTRLGYLLGQPAELSPAAFHAHYDQRRALPLPAVLDLSSNQVARLMENTVLPVGVDLDVQPVRVYHHGLLAAHVLGYLRKDNSSFEGEEAFFNFRLPDYRGVIGIEGVFDAQLRGRAGVKSVLVNYLGYRQSENIWTPAEPGQNVVLTLDVELQRVAEKALAEAGRDTGQPTRGAVVVMEVHTGDLLVLASAPAYDPNDFLPAISPELMEQLNDPQQRPFINRATQERYPPGSIFKIITALAALEAGVLDPQEIYQGKGYAQVGDTRIGDTAPPGPYDFRRAFKLSSNDYFIHYGLRAGLEALLRVGQRLHLGEPVDLPTGQNDPGFFPTREWMQQRRARGVVWSEGDTANLCIGQGYLAVNPVQMAVMTAAIANGGRVLYPRLVQRVEPMEITGLGQNVVEYPPRLRGELGVHPRHLELVRDAMLADVEDPDATGRRAAVPGFRIGGKTGTAEVKQGRRVVDKITWFVAFGPYEHPQYAVVVMVESGASGGFTCAPVAAQIFKALRDRQRPAPLAMHSAQ
ncbi:MAG: penicillin-binding transpeptidase domain-containing protein [Verrucomicrobiae bacterium]|nr:penicillin-binding transpeptidase domain-containing protein [Verrucomicrobiae bacterium]